MRIIKNYKKCRVCNTLVELEEKDKIFDYTNSNGLSWISTKCPVCECEFIIDETQFEEEE